VLKLGWMTSIIKKSINLKPYGFNWTLEPAKEHGLAVPFDVETRLNTITTDDNSTYTSSGGTVYTKGIFMGGGTYGQVYECKRSTGGPDIVIKIINGSSVRSLVQESIIQILIVEYTKGLVRPEVGLVGPYAPYLYEIAWDPVTKTCYIFSEKMRATTMSIIRSRKDNPVELTSVTTKLLSQICVIMKDLWHLIKFNHRDFKTDNCMYVRDAQGNIQTRLIDFGFSCLQIGKNHATGGGMTFRHCSLEGRDLTQYIYELYKYQPATVALRDVYKALLTFPIKGNTCYMWNKCRGMKEWRNTYGFLNDDTIINPNGTPEVVGAVISAFMRGQDITPHLAYTAAPYVKGVGKAVRKKVAVKAKTVKACAAGQERNPMTGRCIKVCKPGFARNATFKCKAVPKVKAFPVPVPKPCAAGLEKNPKTGRCVKVCKSGYARNATFKCKALPKAKAAPIIVAQLPCGVGQERNPKTGRCIKVCRPGYARNATFKCKAVPKAVAAVAVAGPRLGCPAAKPNYNPKTRRCVLACKPGFKRNATFKCRSTRKA
jgi:Protein kinase domain